MADGNDNNLQDIDYNPHNIDAEQSLLGTLLVNNEVFDYIQNILCL